MRKNACLRENEIFRIQLLPSGNLEKVEKNLKKLKNNEEYVCNSFIRKIPERFSDLEIDYHNLLPFFERYFRKAEYVENRLFLIIREKLQDVITFTINDESFIHICFDHDDIVKDVFFDIYLEKQDEKKKLLSLFLEIQDLDLILVDWDAVAVMNLKDTEALGDYLEKNIERYRNFYSEQNMKKNTYELPFASKLIPLVLNTLVFAYLIWRVFARLGNETDIFLISLVFISAALLVGVYFLGLFAEIFTRITTKRDSIVIEKFLKKYEIKLKDIESYEIKDNSHVLLYHQIGKKKEKIYLRVQLGKDSNELQQYIKDNIVNIDELKALENIKKWIVDSGGISRKTLGMILKNSGYNPITATLRRFFLMIKCMFGREKPDKLEEFKTEYGGISGFHLGYQTDSGSGYFIFYPSNSSESFETDFSSIAGESLEVVGKASDYRYTVYVSESGKMYCVYENYLMLLGNEIEEGLENLLLGKKPLKIIDIFDNDQAIFDYTSSKWLSIYSGSYFLKDIHLNIINENDILYGKNIFPLMTDPDESDFIIYEMESKRYFFISKPNGDVGETQIDLLDDVSSMKKFLGPALFDCRLMIPVKYTDEIVNDANNILQLGLTNSSIKKILSVAHPEKRYVFSGKSGSSSFFSIDRKNKDWHVFYALFHEDKIKKIDEMINSYWNLISSEYGIAYDNFNRYFNKYPGSFLNPLADMDPIHPYFIDVKNGSTGGFSEFSIPIDNRLTHEVVLDICSIIGLKMDIGYLRRVYENDGNIGRHCLASFADKASGEFVVLDCQNTDRVYQMVVRCRKQKGDYIKKRLMEWDDFFRYNRGNKVEKIELKDEFRNKKSIFEKLLEKYGLSEEDIFYNDIDQQFKHLDSFLYKSKIYLRDRYGWLISR